MMAAAVCTDICAAICLTACHNTNDKLRSKRVSRMHSELHRLLLCPLMQPRHAIVGLWRLDLASVAVCCIWVAQDADISAWLASDLSGAAVSGCPSVLRCLRVTQPYLCYHCVNLIVAPFDGVQKS